MSTDHNIRSGVAGTEVLPLTSLTPYARPNRLTRGASVSNSYLLHCCFASTEARWLIRTGTEWEGDERVKARPRTTSKKTGETVDLCQNMEVLRRCPFAIAQRLVHCAIDVSTAVIEQSHKDNVRCTAVDEQLGQLEAKEVQLSQLSSTSLLMISSGLT